MRKLSKLVPRLLRMASTGDASPGVQDAADDLFECALALADEPSVVARRHLLDAAFGVVQAARLRAAQMADESQMPSQDGEKR